MPLLQFLLQMHFPSHDTVKRRRARFTPELSRTNSADLWFNWLKYFLQDPREIVHLEIAGMDYSAEIRRLKNLQQPECPTGEEADGLLEGSYFSCQTAGYATKIRLPFQK